MLLCFLCGHSVNHEVLPFLMISFRLTLQSPFIENEDADIRVRIETRTTDWSLLQNCGVSDVGKWTKQWPTHESLIERSPQFGTSSAGYWRSDPTFECLPKGASNTHGSSVPGMILLLFARDGSRTLSPCHLSLTARRARTRSMSVCPSYRNTEEVELWAI